MMFFCPLQRIPLCTIVIPSVWEVPATWHAAQAFPPPQACPFLNAGHVAGIMMFQQQAFGESFHSAPHARGWQHRCHHFCLLGVVQRGHRTMCWKRNSDCWKRSSDLRRPYCQTWADMKIPRNQVGRCQGSFLSLLVSGRCRTPSAAHKHRQLVFSVWLMRWVTATAPLTLHSLMRF